MSATSRGRSFALIFFVPKFVTKTWNYLLQDFTYYGFSAFSLIDIVGHNKRENVSVPSASYAVRF